MVRPPPLRRLFPNVLPLFPSPFSRPPPFFGLFPHLVFQFSYLNPIFTCPPHRPHPFPPRPSVSGRDLSFLFHTAHSFHTYLAFPSFSHTPNRELSSSHCFGFLSLICRTFRFESTSSKGASSLPSTGPVPNIKLYRATPLLGSFISVCFYPPFPDTRTSSPLLFKPHRLSIRRPLPV